MLLYLTPLWTLWPNTRIWKVYSEVAEQAARLSLRTPSFLHSKCLFPPWKPKLNVQGIWIRLESLSQILVASPHTSSLTQERVLVGTQGLSRSGGGLGSQCCKSESSPAHCLESMRPGHCGVGWQRLVFGVFSTSIFPSGELFPWNCPKLKPFRGSSSSSNVRWYSVFIMVTLSGFDAYVGIPS